MPLGVGGMVGAVVAWGVALLRPAGATVAVAWAWGVAGSGVDWADAGGLVWSGSGVVMDADPDWGVARSVALGVSVAWSVAVLSAGSVSEPQARSRGRSSVSARVQMTRKTRDVKGNISSIPML